MNREKFLRHLRDHGCELYREGGSHSLWINPVSGRYEAVPRHQEIKTPVVRKICRVLGIERPSER